MYSRQEIAKQKEAFWTTFGKYMQPVKPAAGEKVNWINYKTGIQGISFRMDADNKRATAAVVLSHGDASVREQHYQQLLQLKNVLHNVVGEDWTWEHEVQDEHGKQLSRIGTVSIGVNILNNADWPALISFFKPRIMALDTFWNDVKYAFEV